MVITIFKRGIGNIAGRLCEIFIPINDAYFIGKGTIAICVFSGMDLLQAVARSEDMMENFDCRKITVGEQGNRYADSIYIKILGVGLPDCMRDVKGHQSGQALLSLSRNGVTTDGSYQS